MYDDPSTSRYPHPLPRPPIYQPGSAPQASSMPSPYDPIYPTSSSYPNLPNPATSPYSYGMQARSPSRTPSIPAVPYTSPPRSSSSYRQAYDMPDAAPPRPPKLPVSPPRAPKSRSPTKKAESRSPPVDEEPNVSGLRTVYLPGETLHKFMRIAAVNTERKRETCGLLLGKKRNNSYTVQTLLVPRQTSDENSCTMVQEEMVFEFQEKRDLLTLGWVRVMYGLRSHI